MGTSFSKLNLFCTVGLAACVISAGASVPELLVGDVDQSGQVNVADLRLLSRVIRGEALLAEQAWDLGDVNRDGAVTVEDQLRLEAALTASGTRPLGTTSGTLRPVVRTTLHAQLTRNYGSVVSALTEARQELENQAMWLFSRNPSLFFENILQELRLSIHFASHYHWAPTADLRHVTSTVDWVTQRLPERRMAVASFAGTLQPEANYVQACAARLRGQSRVVQRRIGDQCFSPSGGVLSLGLSTTYVVGGGADGLLDIRIPVQIRMPAGVSSATQLRVVRRWNQGVQCVSNFFHRYGVKLEVRVDPALRGQSIELVPGPGRSNGQKFYVESDPYLCGMMIHEFGHYLGLPDEYQEAGYRCPARVANPDPASPMLNSFQEPHQLRLREHHFLEILEPLCGAPAVSGQASIRFP